jgi:hypothetical protein
MDQMLETTPPGSPEAREGSSDTVIGDFFELPLETQLGVLRTIFPKTLAQLSTEECVGFLRDMAAEIRRAAQGEACYDIRSVPTY